MRVWANFRQRALDTAIAVISKKTDISIAIESLERSKHRRVTVGDFCHQGASGAEQVKVPVKTSTIEH
jgi:hypothetical protein